MSFNLKPFAFTFLSLVVAITIFSFSKRKTLNYTYNNEPVPVVVMELFTSQGCSSCPPADDLLGTYASRNDERIIPLAFHVDYWNRLGWTDSFSSAKYSARQREYSMVIDNSSVYTPQLVLNGTKELVGSEEGKISRYVETLLKEKPVTTISVDKMVSNGPDVVINYTLSQLPPNTRLNAALLQTRAVTHIMRGENRGLNLTNYNVVRDFISKPITAKSSEISLRLPAGYTAKGFSVVLYTQDDASGKINGAIKKIL